MKIILTILLSICLHAVSAQAVTTVECSFDLKGDNSIEIYNRGSTANFIAFGNYDQYDNEKYNFGHYLLPSETQYSAEDGGRYSALNLTLVAFVSDISHRYYYLNFLTGEITIVKDGGNGSVVADALPMYCSGREGGE